MCSLNALYVIFVVINVALIPSGAALKCYTCKTFEKGCNDPFDENTLPPLVPCDYGKTPTRMIGDVRREEALEFVCAKVSIYGKDINGNRVEGIMRGCAPKAKDVCDVIASTVENNSQNLLKVESCHTCDSDKCNGAAVAFLSSVALFIGIIVTIFTP